MKKGEEGLHGQECGSRYARMDREGCADSTETDWMAGFSHAIHFNIPQEIMLTHNFHNDCFFFFKKETFRFWPFYRKELF